MLNIVYHAVELGASIDVNNIFFISTQDLDYIPNVQGIEVTCLPAGLAMFLDYFMKKFHFSVIFMCDRLRFL